MNWASIDPGAPSGVTIWDQNGKHILTSTVKYCNALDFCNKLQKMKDYHDIDFILIEKFTIFKTGRKNSFHTFNASKVQIQLQLWKEMFPKYVEVHTMQWNPSRWKDSWKRQIVLNDYHVKLKNSHETDSFLLGANIFRRVQLQTGKMAFSALQALAEIGNKKFPRATDRSPWNDLLNKKL